MRKTEARIRFHAERARITSAQASKWDDLLLISFQQADLPFVTAVLSFYPADSKAEVDSFLLTRYLRFVNPGMEVAYPRIAGNGAMEAVLPPHDDAFEPNDYQIMEPTSGRIMDPSEIDLVLVPLLAYDRQGNRVGYGKGYYDRYLSRCRPDCIKVGLSYFDPIDRIDDATEFDIPLDLCITPQAVYVF